MKVVWSFLILSLCFTSCYTARKFEREHSRKSIPADLLSPNYVLLVQKQEDGWAGHQNNMVNNQMRKFYKGKYEMASAKDIQSNAKYADVNVYRYVIRRSSDPLFSIVNKGPISSGGSQITYNDEIIYDRKEKVEFPSTGVASHNYAQGIHLFAKAMAKRS